ncbi:MAG: hypothetical protein ABIS84_12040 [Arachnia sp.]
MSEFARIGDAPRPATSQGMEERLRHVITTEMAQDPGSTVRGLDRVGIRVTVEGADIAGLHINATGLEVVADAGDGDAQAISTDVTADVEDMAQVKAREPGLLRRATFTAAPMLFPGRTPVEVQAEAVDVPFEWLELDDGGLAIGMPEHVSRGQRRAMTLRLHVAFSPDDVLAAVMTEIRGELTDVNGMRLDRESLTFTRKGPRRIRIRLSVRLRWKFLRATCRARTELHIDNRFVARLSGTRVTSSNLLLAVVLRGLRGKINRELSKPLDLQAEIGELLALRTLRIDADTASVGVALEAGLA